MTLAKKSQYEDIPPQPDVAADADGAEEVTLELESPDGDFEEIVFLLPKIPGADDDGDIIIDEPAEIEVADETIEVEDKDPWDWSSRGLSGFLGWVQEMLANVPRHSGRDTTGIERVISYFEAINKEITKAMRQDFRNEIDSAKAEEARSEIENGLERLLDRLEQLRSTKYKRKKKSWVADSGIVKEAQKATHVGGIVVTVPLLISRIARTCINGMVSAGHDIEDMLTKLSKKYDLTNREQAEVMQLLADMGYPVRRDRGFDLDEEISTTSSDNYDWAANFPD